MKNLEEYAGEGRGSGREGTSSDEGTQDGEIQDGAGADNDCEDPDSAYVTAMEQIWAEAEAWVDAEAQASTVPQPL